MVGQEVFLPLGYLGTVNNSPSVDGGEPPMGRLSLLEADMKLD